jgi:hypothetical protein
VKSVTTFTYESENRMTLQQVGAARTTFAYDGDGLRRRMVSSACFNLYRRYGADYLGEIS